MNQWLTSPPRSYLALFSSEIRVTQKMHFQDAVGAKGSSAYCADEVTSQHVNDLNVLLQLDFLGVPLVALIAVEVSTMGNMQALVVSETVLGLEAFPAYL